MEVPLGRWGKKWKGVVTWKPSEYTVLRRRQGSTGSKAVDGSSRMRTAN